MRALLNFIGATAKSLLPLMRSKTITEDATVVRLNVALGTKVVLHPSLLPDDKEVAVQTWHKLGWPDSLATYFKKDGDLSVGFGSTSAMSATLDTSGISITLPGGDGAYSTRVVLDQEFSGSESQTVIGHSDPNYAVEAFVRPGTRVIVQVVE